MFLKKYQIENSLKFFIMKVNFEKYSNYSTPKCQTWKGTMVYIQIFLKGLWKGLCLCVKKNPMWPMILVEWEPWYCLDESSLINLAFECCNGLIGLCLGMKKEKWPMRFFELVIWIVLKSCLNELVPRCCISFPHGLGKRHANC